MKKVAGVQQVTVSLTDGVTILDLRPDNAVTMSKLRQVIKDNGFVSKEAQITARGSVVHGSSGQLFEVRGTRERLPIKDAHQNGDAWRVSVAPSP